MEAIEIVRTQPQRQQRDIIEIQVGQDLQKQRNGKYILVERHPLEKNHPERIPKVLSHTTFGRWVVAPKKANHKGKRPRDKTIIRVEKYKDTKESKRGRCMWERYLQNVLLVRLRGMEKML